MRLLAFSGLTGAVIATAVLACAPTGTVRRSKDNNLPAADNTASSDDAQQKGGEREGEVILEPVEAPDRTGPDGGREATWCDAHPVLFCADFDQGLTLGWTAKGGVHGEIRSITGGPSAPGAFASVTEPVGDKVVARAYLRKDFTEIPQQTLAYEFAVRVEQIGATLDKGGTIAVMLFGSAPNDYELQLNVFSGGKAQITERGPLPQVDGGRREYIEHKLPDFGVGEWKRVSIVMDFRAAGTFSVSVDGVETLSGIQTVAPIPRTAPTFFLGVSYVDPPSATWDVRYDNVAVDIR